MATCGDLWKINITVLDRPTRSYPEESEYVLCVSETSGLCAEPAGAPKMRSCGLVLGCCCMLLCPSLTPLVKLSYSLYDGPPGLFGSYTLLWEYVLKRTPEPPELAEALDLLFPTPVTRERNEKKETKTNHHVSLVYFVFTHASNRSLCNITLTL